MSLTYAYVFQLREKLHGSTGSDHDLCSGMINSVQEQDQLRTLVDFPLYTDETVGFLSGNFCSLKLFNPFYA